MAWQRQKGVRSPPLHAQGPAHLMLSAKQGNCPGSSGSALTHSVYQPSLPTSPQPPVELRGHHQRGTEGLRSRRVQGENRGDEREAEAAMVMVNMKFGARRSSTP